MRGNHFTSVILDAVPYAVVLSGGEFKMVALNGVGRPLRDWGI